MKILILGGTGAMGRHLTEILAANNLYDIYVTSRRVRNKNGNVTYIKGNAHDPLFIDSLLQQKWDTIVDFMVYGTDEFARRIHPLLEAAGQYIFISSARIFAEADTPLSENSPLLINVSSDRRFTSSDDYAITKARQECILRNAGKNWVIVRPYITYSENRLQLADMELEQWLHRALTGHKVPIPDDIASRTTTLTYGRDVAKAIACIISSHSHAGETFNITSPHSATWNRIIDIYDKVLREKTGHGLNILRIPHALERYSDAATFQVKYDRTFNRTFDTSKQATLIDCSEFTTLEQGLRTCLSAYIDSIAGKQPPALDPQLTAIADRATGEHTRPTCFTSMRQRLRYRMFRSSPRLASIIFATAARIRKLTSHNSIK